MTVVYPVLENGITPHGAYHLFKGDIPDMELHAYDDSIVFYVMGGRAIPDIVNAPERVELRALKGLIAPWQTVDQKGATEDGVTFIDALYDPIEVEATVVAKGRTPARTRRVVTDLIASIDAKKTSELSFYTQDLGRWWAPVRWFKTPIDAMDGIHTNRQTLSLRLRADNGFWRTYDDVGTFGFEYTDMTDTFSTDYSGAHTLGANWPQYYTGTGTGYCSTAVPGVFNVREARWYENGTGVRTVVNGPYKNFSTSTDNQVVSIVLGSFPEITFPGGAYNDIWGRMSRDGSGNWTGYGIRLRVGLQGLLGHIELSRFNNFSKTVLRERILIIPPLLGEKFTLVCGYPDDPRQFVVQRNGIEVMNVRESGTGSALGASYRGVGFGMEAGAGIISQASPAWVRKISAGDNSTIAQSGFIQRTNIGDQPMYDRHTCYGPGLFEISNGPGGDMVQFGPLLPNQVVQLRTDPRKRGVVDITKTPPTSQELGFFAQALKDFISFATGNNVPPLLLQIESLFGIAPPQGNLYSLLNGRFTDDAAIPQKSPGNLAQPYNISVSVSDGNASTRVVSAGTPLRRYPL